VKTADVIVRSEQWLQQLEEAFVERRAVEEEFLPSRDWRLGPTGSIV
jgi:hypothetical protein